ARKQAIQDATKYAIQIPFRVMETAYNSMEVMKAMAKFGNPNSVTDAGVGALCARTAVLGAFMNVKINAGDLEDKDFVSDILAKGNDIQEKTMALETEIRAIIESKI
ncbi:MAG: cyclodeaminase/cyclohydrolase family protein, partial [Flavobacteriales bacterium]|nr:cyclodeaminase/cyclohydrolase family protein [Flavobacteriales bacterium]